MTANQIAYAKLREDQRHNVVSEGQKDRDLAIGESTAVSQRIQAETASRRQSEDARHNFEQESIDWWKNQSTIRETSRHNRQAEVTEIERVRSLAGLQQAQSRAALIQANASERQAAAQERSSMASQISASAAQTSAAASYLASSIRGLELQETSRHNVETESIGRTDATSKRITAQAAQSQASTASGKLKLESEVNRKNATSQRISAVAQAVNAGARAVTAVGGLAKSIVKGG